MAFAEDLDAFFRTADFAVAATVGAVTGVGIFDNPTGNILGGIIENTDPVLTVKTADFPAAAVGDTVSVQSLTLKVASVEPNGTGITRLVLK